MLVRRSRSRPIIGVNIGKSRITPVESAIDDYRASTTLLAPYADYLVVNVSSPNTPGLRGLQELDQLEPLLCAVRDEAGAVPVLVKISPDMDDEQVAAVSVHPAPRGLAGIVAPNTTHRPAGLRSDTDEVAAAGEG
jgi:dihydroorotate dehydrogenase